MFRQKAFTIIELMIAILVVGVLSTLAVTNYNNSVARSNFKMMREVAAKFALSQQEHRQRYGAYASTVQSSGNSAASTMIFAEATNYSIKVSSANIRTFVATITPTQTTNNASRNTPEDCRTIQITSEQGYLSYLALDNAGNDNTNNCMPNG
jgi:type IV pilus assembly protein PilE